MADTKLELVKGITTDDDRWDPGSRVGRAELEEKIGKKLVAYYLDKGVLRKPSRKKKGS